MSLLLVLLTLGIYWPVTKHEFVDYDDGDYVKVNTQVQRGLTWEGVKWAFTTGHASNWHPLTWLTHMADVSIFGKGEKASGGPHIVNALIHCANTVLVFLWFLVLTGASWRSAIVAALFALHPLHVESVAWVSERKDVLSTFFGLLALLAYAKYAAARSSAEPTSRKAQHAKRFYILALLALAVGLLCKPMLVTLPFVMLLLDYWPLKRVSGVRCQVSGKRANLALLWEKIPFFVLVAVSSTVTFVVQRKGGAVSSLESLPLTQRVANTFVSYVRYLRKTFWPDDLSILYPHPGSWPAVQIIGAIVLLLIVSAGVVLGRRRLPFAMVGWFWFLGVMVPVIGLVQVGIQSMADRYTYVPLIGIFIVLVWGAAMIVERWPVTRWAFASLAGISVVACCIATSFQLRIWRNSETLFRHAVEVTEKNYLAWNNLGFYYFGKGKPKEAQEAYRESLRINPNYADAHNNLGHALAEEKKFAEAMVHYRLALRTSPDHPEIHNNLGNALSETGDIDGAIAEYSFVLKRNPNHADANNNLGIALAMKGQLAEAIEHFNTSLKVKPGNAGAHGNLGNALAVQRKFTEAMEHYRQALELSPNDAQTRNNLGNVLAELGRFDEAVTNYNSALQLNINNPEAHFNLGCVLVKQGRRNEAATHFREAIRLKPDYAAAGEQLRLLESGNPPR